MNEYANTGAVTISTANPNRNGTGSITNVITAGRSGLKIDQVTVKAQGNTTDGMIRFYVFDGSTHFLIGELPVPSVTVSPNSSSYASTLGLGMSLQPGTSLSASTENAEVFNIIASGSDWETCPCV
jgi:hypothetical protein